MASKSKKTPFAIGKDGVLAVELRAVMSPVVALLDGLTLVFFGKQKTPFLKIDTAIEWCRKEREVHDREKYDKMIAVMERAKAQFADECEALRLEYERTDK